VKGLQVSEIAKAIAKVMEEVPYVRKRYSEDLGYSFAGEREMIIALRESVVRNHLVVVPIGASVERRDPYQTKSGTSMVDSVVKVRWKFIHTESGETLEAETLGEGSDRADKGIGKAMTAAFKYVLKESFMVETGDDPDEVVEERSADNSAAFETAWKAIEAADSVARLEKLISLIPTSKGNYDADQQKKLNDLCQKKLAQLQLKK
jgi:hypothetical protein